jgi:hypothetical protein
MPRELMGKEEKIRVIANSMRRDLGYLQVAIMKESKFDIALHLGAALERSEALVQIMIDAQLLRTQ